MTRPIAFCSLVFLTFISISDVLANHSVRGRIINRDGEPLQGATARLTNTRDTTKILGGISNRAVSSASQMYLRERTRLI